MAAASTFRYIMHDDGNVDLNGAVAHVSESAMRPGG